MKKPHWEVFLQEFPGFHRGPKIDYRGHFKGTPFHKYMSIVNQMATTYKDDPHTAMFLTHKDRERIITPEIGGYFMLFMFSQGRIFKMANDFSKELQKVQLNVKPAAIPTTDDRIICIEFPDTMHFHMGDGDYVKTVYVMVTREEMTTQSCVKPVLFIHCMFPLHKVRLDGTIDYGDFEIQEFGLPFKDKDHTFEEALQLAKDNSEYTTVFNFELYRYLLNCLIYIHSGDPDLREYQKPTPDPGQRARQFRRRTVDKSTVDMTLVGFNYMKNPTYSAEMWGRKGHFRWQPYGPNREKVKLIWIGDQTVMRRKGK